MNPSEQTLLEDLLHALVPIFAAWVQRQILGRGGTITVPITLTPPSAPTDTQGDA